MDVLGILFATNATKKIAIREHKGLLWTINEKKNCKSDGENWKENLCWEIPSARSCTTVYILSALHSINILASKIFFFQRIKIMVRFTHVFYERAKTTCSARVSYTEKFTKLNWFSSLRTPCPIPGNAYSCCNQSKLCLNRTPHYTTIKGMFKVAQNCCMRLFLMALRCRVGLFWQYIAGSYPKAL